MTGYYTIDDAAIDELMRSDDMERLMQDVAEDVADIARGIAPKKSGRMAGRIKAGTQDTLFGTEGVVSAPAPANLLSTSTGLRLQNHAYGHVVHIWHKANNAFLKRSLTLFSASGAWS
jgi:hypothetical protein